MQLAENGGQDVALSIGIDLAVVVYLAKLSRFRWFQISQAITIECKVVTFKKLGDFWIM